MADRDGIQIPVTAPGAEQTEQQLKDVARAEQQVGEATKKSGDAADEAGQSQGRLARGLDGVRKQLLSLVGGFGLMAAVQRAWAEYTANIEKNSQALKENARLATESANAQRGLLFLGADRDLVNFAEAQAIAAGRDRAEGTAVAKEVLSARAGARPAQQRALIAAAFQLAQTEGADVSALSLTGPLLQTQLKIDDPLLAASRLRRAVNLAGIGDAQQFGQLAGKAVDPLTQLAGLSPEQALGTVAGLVGTGGSDDVTITGLRTVALRLFGDLTPEAERVLKKVGFDPQSDDLFSGTAKIKRALDSGTITRQELAGLFGAEGITAALRLNDPRIRANIEDYSRQITQTGAGFLPSEIARVEREFPEQGISRESAADRARTEQVRSQDTRALMTARVRAAIERALYEARAAGDVNDVEIESALSFYDKYSARGATPIQAAKAAQTLANEGFVDRLSLFGYGVDADLVGAARAVIINDNRTQYNNTGDPRETPSGRSEGY